MRSMDIGAVLVAVLVLTGCSTFNRQWKAALAKPVTADSIEGPWQGTWTSQVNGHSGGLRAVIVLKTNHTYLARFQARYKKVIPLKFSYSVELEVEKHEEGFKFRGQEDLGALAGGMYHYEGYTGRTNFFSTYRCEMDHGTFQMARPAPLGTPH